MPGHCEVLSVSPLLRELLITAVDLPVEYEPESRAGRIMTLLLDEVRLAPAVALIANPERQKTCGMMSPLRCSPHSAGWH